MRPDLHGKVALVTGAGRGIGAAVARTLRDHGATVAAHYSTTPPTGDYQLFAQDLALPGGAQALLDAVTARLGRLDYLVNNAAFTPANPLRDASHSGTHLSFQRAAAEQEFDPALWERAVAVNLRAPMELALAARGLDAIVNLGSGSTLRGDGSSAYFVVTKGAVPALTQYLARRLAPHTRVNALLPGLISTEEIAARGSAFEPLRQEVIRRTPMGRLGEPEEVAEAVLFLLAGNSFITGTVLLLDGGWHL